MNEIKVKKSVDFLQNLIKYFHAQCKCVVVAARLSSSARRPLTVCAFSFFQDGLQAVETLKPSVDKVATDLTAVRSRQ